MTFEPSEGCLAAAGQQGDVAEIKAVLKAQELGVIGSDVSVLIAEDQLPKRLSIGATVMKSSMEVLDAAGAYLTEVR